jgi:eukaryotic-like serine/threonine-protein kinase
VDGEGKELWRRTVGRRGVADVNHGLAIYPDGRILVSGYAQTDTGPLHDLLAITLSAQGEVLTHELFGGAGDDRGMLARLDEQGRAWITGYTQSAGAGGWDLFVARLDRNGRFEPYLTTFGGPADDHGTVVQPLPDGSLLIGGYAQGLGLGGQDAFVMRVTVPKWSKPARGMRRQSIAVR